MTRRSEQSAVPRLWKALFVGVVAVTCIRVWAGPDPALPRAQAQIPDAGSQRQEAQRLAKETNRLLAEILATLQDRTLNVRLASTDNNGAGKAAPGSASPRR